MINAINSAKEEDRMDLKTRIGQKFLVVTTLRKTLEVLELAGITDKSDILFQSDAGTFRVVYRREVYDGLVQCYPLDTLISELLGEKGSYKKTTFDALKEMLYGDQEA